MKTSTQQMKQFAYDNVVKKLAPLWEQDAELLEKNPTDWQTVRTIDDWLVERRDDLKTIADEYRKKAKELIDICVK